MDAEIYVKALRMWPRCIPLQSLQQWSDIKVFLITQLSSQNVLYMYIYYVKNATVDFVSISGGNVLPALSLNLESPSMIPVLSSHLVSLNTMIQYACTSILRRTMSFSCQSSRITFPRSKKKRNWIHVDLWHQRSQDSTNMFMYFFQSPMKGWHNTWIDVGILTENWK